jgi:hypothetical protein
MTHEQSLFLFLLFLKKKWVLLNAVHKVSCEFESQRIGVEWFVEHEHGFWVE